MATTSDSFLVIDPPELRFKGPFKDVVSRSSFTITNTSDMKVTYKVQTTAPKRYYVRHGRGILNAGASINIAVKLQTFNYDPTEKNEHKFMVQTMFLPDGDTGDLESLWKNATPEHGMKSSGIWCVFELPDDVPDEAPAAKLSYATRSPSDAVAQPPRSHPRGATTTTTTTTTTKGSHQVCRQGQQGLRLRQPPSPPPTRADERQNSDASAASRPGRSVQAADGISEDLECPICLEMFRRPTTLGCGHTFCADCQQEMRAQSGDTCPICRAPIESATRSVTIENIIRSMTSEC